MSEKTKILLYSDQVTKEKAIEQSAKMYGKSNVSRLFKYLIDNNK